MYAIKIYKMKNAKMTTYENEKKFTAAIFFKNEFMYAIKIYKNDYISTFFVGGQKFANCLKIDCKKFTAYRFFNYLFMYARNFSQKCITTFFQNMTR